MDYSFKKDPSKKKTSRRSSNDPFDDQSSNWSACSSESTSNFAVTDESLSKLLRQKGKRATASLIQSEVSANGYSKNLEAMMDDILSPDKDIFDSDNIEWCKWIMAGGKSPIDFSSIGEYNELLIMNNYYLLKKQIAYCEEKQHMEIFFVVL